MSSTTIQYFGYTHLPEQLQAISKPIHDLAHELEQVLPDGAEKSAGMRKLLEAKDCFVRAAIASEPNVDPLAGMIEGAIVHYVMPDGEHRPAIIVRVWDKGWDNEFGKGHVDGDCNLTVFTDWTNDDFGIDTNGERYIMHESCAKGLMRQTSCLYSEKFEPNTWHWTEK